jgi:hypothetical protein
MEMKNYDAALLLMTENLEQMRQLEGDNVSTLTMMTNLAELHCRMNRQDLALPLLRDTLQRSRRVLGNHHGITLLAMQMMGQSLHVAGDTAAGSALLEEAVACKTASLGADHPETQTARAIQELICFFEVGELASCDACGQRLKAPVRCNVLACPKCENRVRATNRPDAAQQAAAAAQQQAAQQQQQQEEEDDDEDETIADRTRKRRRRG